MWLNGMADIMQGSLFIFTFISKSLGIRRTLSSGIKKPSSSVVCFFSLPFYSHSSSLGCSFTPSPPCANISHWLACRSMSFLPLPVPIPSASRANYYLHWRQRHYFYPSLCYSTSELHVITFQKVVLLAVTGVTFWNNLIWSTGECNLADKTYSISLCSNFSITLTLEQRPWKF